MSRQRDFEAERKRQARELLTTDRTTQETVKRLLRQAQGEIASRLSSQPSDYQLWQLGELIQFVQAISRELGADLAKAAGSGLKTSHAAGVALVDAPLLAAGIRIAEPLGYTAVTQLDALKGFMTHKMEGVSSNLAGQINDRLGLVVIGAQTPFEAIKGIDDIITGGQRRAETIVRTEVGRAYSMATHERQKEAREIVPDLKRVWQSSARLHARTSHALLDGVVAEIDEPWQLLNGTRILFPRDPAAPPAETINCGCLVLPHRESWDD